MQNSDTWHLLFLMAETQVFVLQYHPKIFPPWPLWTTMSHTKCVWFAVYLFLFILSPGYSFFNSELKNTIKIFLWVCTLREPYNHESGLLYIEFFCKIFYCIITKIFLKLLFRMFKSTTILLRTTGQRISLMLWPEKKKKRGYYKCWKLFRGIHPF